MAIFNLLLVHCFNVARAILGIQMNVGSLHEKYIVAYLWKAVNIFLNLMFEES